MIVIIILFTLLKIVYQINLISSKYFKMYYSEYIFFKVFNMDFEYFFNLFI